MHIPLQGELSHDSGVQEMLDETYERPGRGAASASIAAVRAQQAGHSIEMEEMICGLLLTANPFATMSEQARFRKVSIDWHRMLRFPSSWTDHAVSSEVQHQQEVQAREAQQRRWDRVRSVNISATLTKLYDREAQLRGIQEPAMKAIVAQAPRVLAIMRTGGGKSLLFMLPVAGTSDGVTIVIMPTVSLRQD